MMGQPESQLSRNIVKAIEERFGGFWFKVHGGPFQRVGIPDILGCLNGEFYGIEVKMPGGHITDLQARTLGEISASGGHAACVTSVGASLAFVEKTLDG